MCEYFCVEFISFILNNERPADLKIFKNHGKMLELSVI